MLELNYSSTNNFWTWKTSFVYC